MSDADIVAHFPDQVLASALLPHAFDTSDTAHDIGHLLRVWRNVEKISAVEGGDLRILQAATLLHDSVWVDKSSAARNMASRLAGDKARAVLTGLAWSGEEIEAVAHAIDAHSFSASITPKTLEARIFQDADRLDALGMIGVARCLSYSGEYGRSLYHIGDPAAQSRALDDSRYALDHFQAKLFRLGDMFCTATGQDMARARLGRMHRFYDDLMAEIS
ncbi:MAG: HD domain-containing protein [Pseudomonadota bacterium]